LSQQQLSNGTHQHLAAILAAAAAGYSRLMAADGSMAALDAARQGQKRHQVEPNANDKRFV